MATTKDILLGNVSREADAPKEPVQTTVAQSESPTPATGTESQQPRMSYEELYKKLYGEQEEDAKKQEERLKRQKRISALGDGIAALSNLFFATKGAPNMFDANNSASSRARVRYDNFMKQRNADRKLYVKGLRQLGLDQEARDRYNESIAHRNERERISDERYDSEQEYRRGRDDKADRRWQATFDEDKRRSNRSYNFQVQQHNDNVEVRREQARATAARGVRGKQLGFSDGNGNDVSIYENVWKGSMQVIYDTLYNDLAPTDEKEKVFWESQMKKHDTAQKKEDFVKQNWYKSKRAKAQMLSLSKLDPATMTSEVNDGGGLGWGNSNNKTMPGVSKKDDNTMPGIK